jgi:Putative peptidoglycan binding domain
MNNRHHSLFFGTFVLFLFLVAPAISFAASTFARPLHIGSKGSDVSALQQFLKDKGFFTYPTVTGLFGSYTWKAVAAFQTANQLEAVGSVGPLTRALLNAVFANAPSAASPTEPGATASTTAPLSTTVPCSAPPGLTCVPGTSMIQPYAPGNGYTPGFGGGGGLVSVPIAVSTPPVVTDHGILFTNDQFYTQGSYSSYPGMWYLFIDPTLGLGHTAVEGVDFQSSIRVFTSTFPNNTILYDRVPNFPPTMAGVYGFLHVAYGNYDGDAQQVPVTPLQVYTLTNFTNDINWTTTGTTSNLLNEFYLTSSSGNSAAKLFEIGEFPNVPSTTLNYVTNLTTSKGTFVDPGGRSWSVVYGSGAVPYISFYPTNLQNVNGTVYWKDMLGYLISQGLITGNEWINGVSIGIEPYTGAATTTINTFNVNFTGAARVPWTITDLSAAAVSTTTAQLTFNTGAGATSYLYSVNGLGTTTLPTNKIITTNGGDVVLVQGVNSTGSSGWSNAATVPSPRLNVNFVSGSYLSSGTSYGSFAGYLSGTGSAFSRNGAGGYDTAMTQLFSNNVARITSAGLLMEPTSTNYVIQNQFASGWGAAQATLTANATTSPLGTNTAATLKEDSTASASHQATQFSMTSGTASGTIMLSLYAKRGVGTRNLQAFMFDSSFTSAAAGIDLGTGAAGGFGYVGYTPFSSSVNGYWRFGFATGHPADTSFSLLAAMEDSGGSATYNGDNTSVDDIFGYQFEQGQSSGYFSTHPTSYIPTTSSSATRGGDQLRIALPSGVTSVTVTYDDGSTQVFSGLSGSWLVPTTQLNRPQIKSIVGI